MSALGQKQTFAVQNGMSAFPPIADMCGATRHVRFVPIADAWTAQASRGRKCISVPTLLVLTCRRRSRPQRQRQTLVTWLSPIAQRFPKLKVGDSSPPGTANKSIQCQVKIARH
jgi:hypothetical protein